MTKLKKRLGLLACAAVLVIGTVGATMAYFTDTKQATNTFTVGQVGITLDEAEVNEAGEVVSINRVTENEYHLIPGHTYVKDPTVHVDADSDSCYVYVKVENGLEAIVDDPTIEAQISDNGWTALNGVEGMYYKEYTAPEQKPAKGTDFIVFENFKVKGEAVTNAELAKYKDAEIKVTAYAIQKTGFDTAEEAWNTAKGQFEN